MLHWYGSLYCNIIKQRLIKVVIRVVNSSKTDLQMYGDKTDTGNTLKFCNELCNFIIVNLSHKNMRQ